MKNIIFRPLTEKKDFEDLKRLDKLLIKTFDGQIELLTIDEIGDNCIVFFNYCHNLYISHFLADTGIFRHIYLVK